MTFPSDVPVNDFAESSTACSAYLTISNALKCSMTSQVLTVTSGFANEQTGSWMVGLLVNNVVNPGTPFTSSGF